jgi:hypothetical protein
VDEEVSIWHFWPFEGVGVGYADYPDWLDIWRRESGRSTQTEKYLVNRVKKSYQGRSNEVVRNWTAMKWTSHGCRVTRKNQVQRGQNPESPKREEAKESTGALKAGIGMWY